MGVGKTSFVALFFLFFFLAFGLGYYSLNRFDSRFHQGTSDSRHYADMLMMPYGEVGGHHYRYRVFFPSIAKPIYQLIENRNMGTWNKPLFALLVVNSAVGALVAMGMLYLSSLLMGDLRIGLIASLLLLSSQTVAHYHLVGLIEMGVMLNMLCLYIVLYHKRYEFLPILGLVAGLTKESLVLIGSMACFVSMCMAIAEAKSFRPRFLFYAGYPCISLIAFFVCRHQIDGYWTLPWELASKETGPHGFWFGFSRSFFDKAFWYTFIWLMPLAALGWKRIPATIAWPCLAATAMNFFLSCKVVHGRGYDLARYCLNAGGPIFALAAASFIWIWLEKKNQNLSTLESQP